VSAQELTLVMATSVSHVLVIIAGAVILVLGKVLWMLGRKTNLPCPGWRTCLSAPRQEADAVLGESTTRGRAVIGEQSPCHSR